MGSPDYSLFRDTYVIPIIVFWPASADGDPLVYCHPFIVPKGSFRIVWNLVTLGGVLGPAHFNESDGITELYGPPYKLTDGAPVSVTQWAASLCHECLPLVDGIAYEVRYHFGSDPGKVYSSHDPSGLRHDPTIVVSRDPIEPPMPYGGW